MQMGPSIRELWDIHVKKMELLDEPSASLPSFYRRLDGLGWSVERAVNTPANVRYEKRKGLRKILFKIKLLWKSLSEKR